MLNNKILRILQKKNFRSHRAELYLDYNTLPVNLLFNQNILSIMHKCMFNKQLLPTVFHNYMTSNKNVHSHDTRSKNLLHLTQVSTSFGLRAIDVLGAKLWNSLPSSIANLCNYHYFRKMVREFLLTELSHT